MRRFQSLSVLLLICVGLTTNSCSSSKLGKLEGQWQLFWINNLADNNIYVWNFEEGEVTILEYDTDSPLPQPTVGARAQYKTSAGFTSAVVEISGFVQSESSPNAISQISNGQWTIDVIDNEVLRLATADQAGSNGSYVIREFTRVE